MRIGLIVYGGLHERSGGFLYDRKLVEALRHARAAVKVFALPWRRYLPHLADNFRRGLERKVLEADLDLLLEDELCHPSLIRLNRRLRQGRRLPIVAIVHHLRSDESHPAWALPAYRMIERAYLSSVDGLICNSRATLRSARTMAGLDRPGIVVPPAGDHLGRGLSAGAIAARARRPGPLRVLFLGNLIPRKGLLELVGALARLAPSSWRLTVAGDPEVDPRYTGRVRRTARRLGLDGRIRFAGALSPARVAAQLRRAQVLAVPSSHEGFGIAYLEGMAFGLPAVAAAHGGAGDLVRDGYNGYLVDPENVSALAERMARLAVDRDRLARMSLAARRTFLRRPTWRSARRRWVRFLRRFARPSGLS
jgi:glycosyltransferase involved in cell wall biosynthesis